MRREMQKKIKIKQHLLYSKLCEVTVFQSSGIYSLGGTIFSHFKAMESDNSKGLRNFTKVSNLDCEFQI